MKHRICLIAVIIPQLIYCMEKQEIEIVIQVDPSNPQAPEPAPADEGSKPQTLESADLAKKAVRVTLGVSNDYLERMLAKRIDGKMARPKIIPIRRIPETTERERLRAFLAAEAEKTQKASVELLSAQQGTEATSLETAEQNQALTRWVLNAVLDEKLKDRDVRENSDYWKYINGALAAVLPIVTGIVQYFLTHHNCSNASSN